MKLRELNIELQTYGEFRGRYIGKVKFDDDAVGSICLTLDPDLALALLATCGQQIVGVSTKAAQQLRANIEMSIAEAKQGPALTA